MKKIKVHWVTQESDQVANALGYGTHNKKLKKAAEEYFDFDDNSPIALTITPADQYMPAVGKFNVLFTMWEFIDVPPTYIEGLRRADLVIVPCNFCKKIFEPYTKRLPVVCWEGVDPAEYPYRKREFPRMDLGEKFRFLWVGAPNPRKGTDVMNALAKIFQNITEVEIYCKTTMPQINWLTTLKNTWRFRRYIFETPKKRWDWIKSLRRALARIPKPSLAGKLTRMGKRKNVIFDTRLLSKQELLDLYYSAHCFILPTFGEGWGLTLCEAMATGCPSIASDSTGCKDFFNDQVGYPVKVSVKPQNMPNYGLAAAGTYVPDVTDCFAKMTAVFNNYKEAQRRAQHASTRIHSKFTWQESARRLYDIIKKVDNGII